MNIQAEIKLMFHYFHFRYDVATKPIECSRRGSLCVTYDYVEVRDGGYEASPLVGM